jgi:hypothetical protein
MYPRSTERHYLYASIRNLMQIVALRSLLDCLETEALRQCKHFGLIRVVDPCCSEVYRPACGCRPRPGLPANPVFGFEDKNRQAGSMDTTCSLQAAEASSHDDYVYRVAHVGRMVWCGRGCCGSSEHVGRGFGAEDLIFIRSSKTPDCSHQMCQLPTKPTQINSLHPFCSRASRERRHGITQSSRYYLLMGSDSRGWPSSKLHRFRTDARPATTVSPALP